MLQVEAADIQVMNSTAENSILIHHKCFGPLENFPNLTLGVTCYPGSTNCGSVKNCSATGKVLPYNSFMLMSESSSKSEWVMSSAECECDRIRVWLYGTRVR